MSVNAAVSFRNVVRLLDLLYKQREPVTSGTERKLAGVETDLHRTAD